MIRTTEATMISTILTPIDGSAHARAALELSMDLAKAYEARLVVLHVGMRDGNVPEDLYEAASRELAQAEQRGEKTGVYPHLSRHLRVMEYFGHMVVRQAQQAAADKGIKNTDTVVDFGGAGERILHHAKQSSADLIVMGSRGYSELEGLFLGSVSHKVFHQAPCPCITVHQTDGAAGFEGIKTIVVATDGSAHAAKAIELASDIAARYGARLILLHALHGDADAAQLCAAVDMDRLSESTREELVAAQQLVASSFGGEFIAPTVSVEALKEVGNHILERGERAAKAKGVRNLELRLVDEAPARAILAAARSEAADLIALGSRGLGEVEGLLAGSVSYKVNHAAPCSCMVVH